MPLHCLVCGAKNVQGPHVDAQTGIAMCYAKLADTTIIHYRYVTNDAMVSTWEPSPEIVPATVSGLIAHLRETIKAKGQEGDWLNLEPDYGLGHKPTLKWGDRHQYLMPDFPTEDELAEMECFNEARPYEKKLTPADCKFHYFLTYSWHTPGMTGLGNMDMGCSTPIDTIVRVREVERSISDSLKGRHPGASIVLQSFKLF